MSEPKQENAASAGMAMRHRAAGLLPDAEKPSRESALQPGSKLESGRSVCCRPWLTGSKVANGTR